MNTYYKNEGRVEFNMILNECTSKMGSRPPTESSVTLYMGIHNNVNKAYYIIKYSAPRKFMGDSIIFKPRHAGNFSFFWIKKVDVLLRNLMTALTKYHI